MRWVVRILSSLWLTVPVLLALGAAVAWASLWHADPETGAIRRDVYRSWWFNALLATLAVNIAVCTFKRKPFRLPMLGYLVAHVGLLIVLASAAITNFTKRYGQVQVFEGESSRYYAIEGRRELRVLTGDDLHRWDIPFGPYEPADLDLRFTVADPPLSLTIRRFEPHVDARYEYEPAETGVPAVQITRIFQGREDTEWLARNSPLLLGGPGLALRVRPLSEENFRILESAADDARLLVVRAGGTEVRLDAANDLDVPFDLGDGAQVRWLSILPQWMPEGSLPEGHPPAPADPAAVLEFRASGERVPRRYVVWARDPAGPAMDKQTRLPTDRFEAVFVAPVERSEITLYVWGEDTVGIVQTSRTGMRRVSRVRCGETFRMAFMPVPLEFRIERVLARARRVFRVAPAPLPEGEPANGAVRLTLRGAREETETWVDIRHGPQDVLVDGRPVSIVYGPKVGEIPFEIRLERFVEEYYPGTDKVKRWRSEIVLEDRARGYRAPYALEVNRPVRYSGWVLYQAGYIRPEATDGRRWGSVIQVSYDPGKPVLYMGSVLGIAGIIGMVIVKPLVLRRMTHGARG